MEPIRSIGGGAITPERSWRPLAAGEFLIGYPDEAQELSSAGKPFDLTRNGTFMADRKLSQDVDGFHEAMTRYAETYARIMQIPVDEADETVRAKIAGRWPDGIPLMAPTYAEYQAFKAKAKAQAEAASAKARTALSLEAGLSEPTAQRLAFTALRALLPNLLLRTRFITAYENTGTAIVTRYADVKEVLARGGDFAVVYGPRMRMITGGENFFLGIDKPPNTPATSR